jgi:hypothetical protein
MSLPGHGSGSVVQTNMRGQEQVVNTLPTPQEQRAIVIPVEGEAAGPNTSSSCESSVEVPHARGPPMLGVADMGLQNGRGIELSLADSEAVEESQEAVSSDHLAEAGADRDGDIALDDAAGRSREGSPNGRSK